jgi:predicted peptidase
MRCFLNNMNFSALFIICLALLLSSCEDYVSSMEKTGPAGNQAEQTAIERDTQGNTYGYYEYLPADFDPQRKQAYAIIFYWNGQNAISGNGKTDLNKLLTQGLPQYINEGRHYPAIIISGMLPDWKGSDVAPFVDYILNRYNAHIDKSRVYMTGFSAGGGVTLRYIAEHPEHIAAYIAIAPAATPPNKSQPSSSMSKIPSWFIHNSGDMTVEIWRSNQWNRALRKNGGDHKISRPDLETHHAWKKAYSSKETWQWLFSKRKNISSLGTVE